MARAVLRDVVDERQDAMASFRKSTVHHLHSALQAAPFFEARVMAL